MPRIRVTALLLALTGLMGCADGGGIVAPELEKDEIGYTEQWDWGSISIGTWNTNCYEDETSIDSCDGHGSGGSGTPPEDGFDQGDFSWEEVCNPNHEPGCVWRKKEDWTQGEIIGVQASIDVIRNQGCTGAANLLDARLASGQLQLWDQRVTRFGQPLYGRVDPSGVILLWTGYDARYGDNVSWPRTLAHEAIHVLQPNLQHGPAFTAAVNACLP